MDMEKLAPSVIGAIGSLGSTALGQSMNSASSAQAFKRAEQAASTAWERQMWAYQRRYQMTTWDMKKAGLNPILAATGGFQVGGPPSVNMANVHQQAPANVYDFSNSGKNIAEQYLKTAETETETKKQELLKNQALTELEKAVNYRKQAGKFTAEEAKLTKEISLITGQLNKIEYETRLVDKSTKLTDEQINHIKLTNQQLQFALSKLEKIHNVYKGKGGQFAAWVNSLFGNLNLGGGVTAGAMMRR